MSTGYVAPSGRLFVVLDRVEYGNTPPCTQHGRTTCCACSAQVWLGSKSARLVEDGAVPVCVPCAHRLLPFGSQPLRNVADHLHIGGPHQ